MISSILPKKTVDSVLAGFSRMIDDLQQVMHQQDAEAARQAQIAQDALLASEAAKAEAIRASGVINKIRGLIGA